MNPKWISFSVKKPSHKIRGETREKVLECAKNFWYKV